MIRYTEFPLPEIAYVPGVTARPTEEPLSREPVVPQSLSENPPIMNPFFLYGVDLYNHGYFWEAHEAWEIIWHLEKNSTLNRVLKGLIQSSGGYLKIIQNVDVGARKLWHRSTRYLTREILDQLGIEFTQFFEMVEDDDGICSLCLEKLFIPICLRISLQ